MTEHLDEWIAALAGSPLDCPLGRLGEEVGREIAARRKEARSLRALAPIRFATVGLALAIGVGSGGAVALAAVRTPHAAGPFSAAAELAPSTLLEDAR